MDLVYQLNIDLSQRNSRVRDYQNASIAIKIGASLWLTALAGWWILAKLSFLQKKNFGGFWGIVRSTL